MLTKRTFTGHKTNTRKQARAATVSGVGKKRGSLQTPASSPPGPRLSMLYLEGLAEELRFG